MTPLSSVGEHFGDDESDDPRRARADYLELRDALGRVVIGNRPAINRLAIAGVQHVRGHGRQRFVLIGPPGCGKTLMIRTLAQLIGLPYLLIDSGSAAETNWSGVDIPAMLAELRQSALLYGGADQVEWYMRRAVICLDEIDKVAATQDASGSGLDYRRGQQQSLLALVGGGVPVRYHEGGAHHGAVHTWMSDEALVIGAGAFVGLPAGATASDLIRFGLMPELVERLGQVIRIPPLRADELAIMLDRELGPARSQYVTFGFELQVSPGALRYVADAVASGVASAGPRTGTAWLLAGAARGLEALLELGAPPRTTYVLTPDDIAIPRRGPPPPPVDGPTEPIPDA